MPMPQSTPESTSTRPLRIATRESRLALWQAEHVRGRLAARLGVEVSLVPMTTRGDEILDRTLSKVGGKGLFVKELETAMAERRADLAVHSLKDVPMELPPGFALAAVLEREDPRDAFVSNRFGSLEALPEGAIVGTASLRRVVQLTAIRPDLRLVPVRGNLDTRLAKVDRGEYDAIVLAAAGLKRLGAEARIREVFEPERMLPCAAQGALGLETRDRSAGEADAALADALAALSHRPTHLAALAERAVSRALGGSCTMPLAAYATWTGAESAAGGTMRLRAVLGHAETPSSPLLKAEHAADVDDAASAEALGAAVARALDAVGAGPYLRAAGVARP